MVLWTAPATAQVSWKRVGTVTTLTNGQLCKTDGTVIICDGTTPTIVSGLVGIGTTLPSQLLTVGGNIDITGTNGYLTEISNDGTTGTTASKLAKLTASGAAIIAATTDTDGILGIVTGGAGTTGNAQIAVDGQASCVFDGATTAGDFVAISSTTAGDCHDAGATRSTTSQTIGRVLSTNGSGGTYAVEVGLNAATASSGAVSGSGTTNYIAKWTPNGSTLGIGALYDDGSGHVGIGTTSPAGMLQVGAGTGQSGYALNVTPSGGTAGATAFFQDTTATTGKTLVVVKAGANDYYNNIFQVQGYGGDVFGIDAYGNASITGGTLYTRGSFNIAGMSNNTSLILSGSSTYVGYNNTSGETPVVSINNGGIGYGFFASSGNGIFDMLSLTYLVNQTSTATGATRGIYVNPTLTSAYDFRAIETGGYTFNLLGSPTTLQQVLFNAPTLAAASSNTITNAATQVITGAPIAGTNVTITHPYALWVQGGTSIFGGNVGIGTTTPGQALEVNGTAKVDTGLIVPLIYPASDSTTAIQIDKANGTSNVVDIDTTNGRVGIGSTAPVEKLDVAGTIKVAGTGSEACSSSTVGQIRYNPAGQYMEICTYP
jgi:hypothetical protein